MWQAITIAAAEIRASAVDNRTPETTRRLREVIDYCETDTPPSRHAAVIRSKSGKVCCIAVRPCSIFIIMVETALLIKTITLMRAKLVRIIQVFEGDMDDSLVYTRRSVHRKATC